MGKRTSYAKLMELAAQKRGKFEKMLDQAERTGDRFAINSATRSIAKLEEYEQQIFNSQEQQKIDKGITPAPAMAYGGLTQFNIGGETDPPSGYLDRFYPRYTFGQGYPISQDPVMVGIDDAPAYNLPQGSVDFSAGMVPNYEVYPEQFQPNPEALSPLNLSIDLPRPTQTPITAVTPRPLPSFGANAEGAQLIRTQLGNRPTSTVPELDADDLAFQKNPNYYAELEAAEAQARFAKEDKRRAAVDKFKTLAPYGAQFLGDMYALNQLNKLERPVDAPMKVATQIGTNIDTSATRARIQDNAKAFNASVDSGMSNSAAVQNVKLANLSQTNRQLADIGQQEVNQELSLRNKQADLLTQNLNANLGIEASNRQRLTDFNNMIRNARLGLIQGMGVKASQMGSEFAQRKLDQTQMDLISRQYSDTVLANNFNDILDVDILNNPEKLKQQMALLNDPDMGPKQRELLQKYNPTLLSRLDELMKIESDYGN